MIPASKGRHAPASYDSRPIEHTRDMSVTVMAQVWQLDLPQNQKLVLLAFADHADDDGYNAYPSVDRVAYKTGFTPRSVQRIVAELRSDGLLTVTGDGPNGTVAYCVRPDRGVKLSPFDEWRESNGRKARGDNDDTEGATSTTQGGDMGVARGASPVSPEPSDNHPQPSSNHQSDETSHHMTEGSLFPVSPKKPVPAKRPVDPYWETLKQIWPEPASSTDPERGRWNRLIKLVRDSGEEPDEIPRRVLTYLTIWPQLGFPTVSAMWSRWTHLGSEWAQMSEHQRGEMVRRLREEQWNEVFQDAISRKDGT